MRELPLDDRPLTRPAQQRLPLHRPGREQILDAHERALESGESMYADPVTGLFVLTARYLADRGTCCGRGCRHCPYVRDGGPDDPDDGAGEGPAA